MTSASKAQSKGEAWWRAYHRRRYAILFYTLLLTLLVIPIVASVGLSPLPVKLLVGACLLTAVMPKATKRSRQAIFAAIALVTLAQFAPDRGDFAEVNAYVPALTGFIGLLAAAGALRFAFTSETVNSEAIYAVLSTYLLNGTFFGQIYWSIETIRPGSIIGPDPFSSSNATYFSFVTLATLGYGDFLPRTAITRGLATFEVIGGQLFLAVLVARLIGAFAPDET